MINKYCSIIIPVLNEQTVLPEQLRSLQYLREAGHELMVVDGGSSDASVMLAEPFVDKIIHSAAGRAKQMNKGAAHARHDWFLFLHVDTELSRTAMKSLQHVFNHSSPAWGRFDVQLSGQQTLYRLIAWFMNKRSRLTGIVTGDQAMFVARDYFNAVAGFPDIALMEDITMSRHLKALAAPICLADVVVTSNRRWQQQGIIRTVLFMWSLRLRYFFGENPTLLAERYHRAAK